MRVTFLAAFIGALTALVSGCAASTNAMVQTLTEATGWGAKASSVQLNPNFRYLRVTVDGRIVFLALGNVERDAKGPIEVWYSAEKEVVRLQNGRVVGAVGLNTEWREVSFPVSPSWSTVANAAQPVSVVRTRDVMPGYRYGVRDELLLCAISAPGRSALQGIDAQSLTWFEERVQPERHASRLTALFAGPSGGFALPPARYAVDLKGGEVVVYGEQCLAADLCFTWQRWDVKPATDAR